MASIGKRSGGYQVRYRDPDGKQRAKQFRRKVDAERFAREVEVDMDRGAYVSPDAGRLAYGAWWAKWEPLQQWSPGTRERNSVIWSKHIEPALGRRELRSIRHSELQALISESKLAPATTKLLRSVLVSSFRSAVDDDLLAKSPAVGLKVAKEEEPAPRPLSAEEQARLLEVCDSWERAWVLTGLGTGVRISEGLAIRLDTLDTMRRTLQVGDQARTLQSGLVELAPLKNRRPRVVPIADDLAYALAHHIEMHGTGAHGVLFPDKDGALMRRQAANHRFTSIVRRAGLDSGITWHNLRDTAATTMLRDGMNPASVAKIIGNTVPVLLSRYAGVLPDDFELARASLNRLVTRAVAS